MGWGWNFKWIDSVGNIVLLYYIFHRNIPNRTYNKHKFWQTCLNLFSPEGFFSSFLKNLIFSPDMNILVKVKKKKVSKCPKMQKKLRHQPPLCNATSSNRDTWHTNDNSISLRVFLKFFLNFHFTTCFGYKKVKIGLKWHMLRHQWYITC